MKNFEAVCLAAIVMTTFTAIATAEEPVVPSAKPAIIAQAPQDNMQVVVIKAKRLTAAEKAALN
ncbi:MAG: hypothetical protein V4723_20115 [Pseudomonadota bacterium]